MSVPPVHMCKEWLPPEDASLLPAAAFLTSALWQPGQTITVSFLDSWAPEWKKAWVQKVVTERLQPFVNVKFDFGNYGKQADIRITFNEGAGAYSRLGTQSTWYKGSSQQPESMNLGWLDEPYSGEFEWQGRAYSFPPSAWRSSNDIGGVIVHEFGHALAMAHEHMSPKGGIVWNEPAVLAYFSGSPNYWSEEQIRYNVMDKLQSDLYNASEFDPDSVMLYAFPAHLTLNTDGTKANPSLSATDKQWLARVYGDPGSGGAATGISETADIEQEAEDVLYEEGGNDEVVIDATEVTATIVKPRGLSTGAKVGIALAVLVVVAAAVAAIVVAARRR